MTPSSVRPNALAAALALLGIALTIATYVWPGDLYANREVGITAGQDLADFADELNRQITILTSDADIVIDSHVGLAGWARPAAQDIGATRTFIAQMAQMRAGLQVARRSMERYGAIVLTKRGMNRTLNTGITRVVETLDRGTATFQKTEFGLALAIRILRRKTC